MSEPTDEIIADALWQKVLDDFESDEAHNKLVEHYRSRNQLGDAAKRYRAHEEQLGDDIDDDTRVQVGKRLDAIATLAMAQLDVRRSEPRRRSLAVSFLMVLVGLFFIAAIASLFRALLL